MVIYTLVIVSRTAPLLTRRVSLSTGTYGHVRATRTNHPGLSCNPFLAYLSYVSPLPRLALAEIACRTSTEPIIVLT